MSLSRRQFLAGGAGALALGGTSLLAACQSQPQPIVVTTAPASAPTTAAPPTPASASSPAAAGASPAAAASPVAAASPAVQPAASVVPAASPAVAASASPSPAVAALTPGAVGKPQYQMDVLHTGRSPYMGSQRLAITRTFTTNQPDLKPDDALLPITDIQSSTTIGPDGTIYATNFLGWLFALKDSPSSANGLDLAWRFRPPNGSPEHCTPVVGRDGTIFCSFMIGPLATPKSTLYALRPPSSGLDGQVVWQTDLPPGGPPMVPAGATPSQGPDGTLYIVNASGILFAIDPVGGQVKWTAQIGNGQPAQFGQVVKVAPAVAPDGTVYVGSLTGSLYAVAPPSGSGNQGSVKWNFDFGEHLGSTPLLTAPVTAPPNRGQDGVGTGASASIGNDGTVYIGSNNSNFYAIDPNGQQKWMYEAERELAGIWTTAALSEDRSTLYFGANKGGIYALDTQSGALKWQFNITGSVYGSPALDAGGTLYTGSTVGHVFSVSTSTGDYITDLDVGAPVWTAPSVRPDGSIVVGDRNGRIVVLKG
ncbi:MAG: PQQ-like beta-propeller repeat protein [Chloroflexi bacterium]|nr:PQQ-like beta-propeller repeat protein [Chloroflexota bacterium]MBV9601173.1 PQQ-like beta-propeller repeat protein [Chloroflexota bacterium]